ncbi:hypothetical protein B0E43_16880 [Algoriphagus sp. A40]|nr:hypothetical protein B0E43_16880 [Algoriphagus sp. A40]
MIIRNRERYSFPVFFYQESLNHWTNPVPVVLLLQKLDNPPFSEYCFWRSSIAGSGLKKRQSNENHQRNFAPIALLSCFSRSWTIHHSLNTASGEAA